MNKFKSTNNKLEVQYLYTNKSIIDTLELIYKKRLISKKEFQAGIYFKFLFFTRYGKTSIKISNCYNKYCVIKNSQQSSYIESERDVRLNLEYKLLAKILAEKDLYYTIANICIYNITPAFLKYNYENQSAVKLNNFYELIMLKNGLRVIIDFLEKINTNPNFYQENKVVFFSNS